MTRSLLPLALGAALLVAAGAPATAQHGAAAPHQDRAAAMQARWCDDLDARQAARLAWLEAKVKPTPAQRAAFDRFLEASRAAAAPLRQLCATPADAPAPQDLAARLAQRERRMAAMLEATRQTRAAVEALQPALDDAQRAALAEHHDGGRARRHMGHHGHHAHHRHHAQGRTGDMPSPGEAAPRR